jgi:hypothetical protein
MVRISARKGRLFWEVPSLADLLFWMSQKSGEPRWVYSTLPPAGLRVSSFSFSLQVNLRFCFGFPFDPSALRVFLSSCCPNFFDHCPSCPVTPPCRRSWPPFFFLLQELLDRARVSRFSVISCGFPPPFLTIFAWLRPSAPRIYESLSFIRTLHPLYFWRPSLQSILGLQHDETTNCASGYVDLEVLPQLRTDVVF